MRQMKKTANREWRIANGKDGERRAASGERGKNSEWRIANGKDGEWRVVNGEW
jgi:hypothetical protein